MLLIACAIYSDAVKSLLHCTLQNLHPEHFSSQEFYPNMVCAKEIFFHTNKLQLKIIRWWAFVDLAMFICNLFILILYIKSEKRTVSPHRFPLPRCGSHVKRSSTLNSSSSKQRVRHFWTAECRIQSNTYDDIKNITLKLYSQYSSEPRTRRSTSLSLNTERARTRDTEQRSGKNKRFYKALLSFGKSRKDATFYKYLDENWEHITEERYKLVRIFV